MSKLKVVIILIASLLLLSSCISNEVIPEQESNGQKIPTPVTQGKEMYKVKTPVKFNVARGSIINNIDNPLDINEIELGLMLLSMEHFSPENFYFQEGQYLNTETINKWLKRESSEQTEGFNPPIKGSENVEQALKQEEENPKIVSHILEQNYVDKDGKTKGISLAISLNSFYYFQVSDNNGLIHSGNVKVDNNNNGTNDVKIYGENIAENVVKRIRNNKKIPNVPILLTLYQEESRGSVVPGRFLSSTFIPEGKSGINDWDNIDKKYMELPSGDAEKIDRYSSESFKNFNVDIEKNFTNLNIKVLGKGLYIDKTLSELSVDIETAGLSHPQLIALIQYVGAEIQSQVIPNTVPIKVNISSVKEAEAVLTWDPASQEIKTHIYNK
ncbi:CamS family sex pheromone protein [Cytobacillus firmus]|uniref:CamS family sex pheromone protein n=1 Tax=Cytobacillus TaxID=2675230 RepID=UPI0021198F9B|nr:CamS family sex pheromone protein [Cytobacillus sp. Bac17]